MIKDVKVKLHRTQSRGKHSNTFLILFVVIVSSLFSCSFIFVVLLLHLSFFVSDAFNDTLVLSDREDV